VTLMTVHSAKGLEFPYVYVVGLEENLFPSIQSLGSRSDLEEERRLFYVAITRSEKKLTLSYAENRYRWGNLVICDPSRFLEEIPEKLIDIPKKASIHSEPFTSRENFSIGLEGFKKSSAPNVSLKNFRKLSSVGSGPVKDAMEEADIQPGMEVEHERFGKGKVLSLEGNGPNKKATVFFPGIGQKQLLLRFARLRKI
ncbi:MAG TPA: 3'-5' exonuclease, partial [Bacteroidales bacterium]|nr:3'-5' exonuclease [Bacteroidales bacterium]